MKRSKLSEQQIALVLRQAEEGTRVEEVCRKAGISVQTYYRWRKKYGGLMPSEWTLAGLVPPIAGSLPYLTSQTNPLIPTLYL